MDVLKAGVWSRGNRDSTLTKLCLQ